MSSLDRNILMPRKKCLNPKCMWISTTERYKCPVCGNTLVSALSQFHEAPSKTVIRRDRHGNVIEDNRDKFESKIDWNNLNK